MLIEFNKYEGAGNDFIIVDNRSLAFPANDKKLISHLCNRRFGIGSDGLILIENHPQLDFEMKYFNSDGRIGTMCGNGGRCAYLYSVDSGLVSGEASFIASDGKHTATIADNKDIILSMNDVRKPEIISGNHFLDTGSPHYIIPVKDISNIDVRTRGRTIRNTKQFEPEGTNVNFVEITNKLVKIRTYERGVEDETLACGTGITAAAISSKWGQSTGNQIVIVEAEGGKLEVSFFLDDEKASSVVLKGPARKIFSGSFEIDDFQNIL